MLDQVRRGKKGKFCQLRSGDADSISTMIALQLPSGASQWSIDVIGRSIEKCRRQRVSLGKQRNDSWCKFRTTAKGPRYVPQ